MIGGFTVIEMMVTVSIFVMITTVVLANYPAFSTRVDLDLLAHRMALTVRQAQVFGLGVRKFRDGSFPAYGVNFNSASPKSFVLFGDTQDNDGRYNEAGCGTNECLETYSLTRGEEIKALCADTGGVAYTDPNFTPEEKALRCGVESLSIVFKRPKPDARIKIDSDPLAKEDASIVLSSVRGDYRTVVVRNTGQISVK